MKKVFLMFAMVTMFGFVSCTKQSPESSSEVSVENEVETDDDEYELIIEGLDGFSTKAGISSVSLDTYGGVAPKSRLLSAKLRNKGTGAFVSGATYTWDNQTGNATQDVIGGTGNNQNDLTAKVSGNGTISATASYHGRTIQSNNVAVNVTSHQVQSFDCDLAVMNPVSMSDWHGIAHNAQSAEVTMLNTLRYWSESSWVGTTIGSVDGLWDPNLSISIPDLKNVTLGTANDWPGHFLLTPSFTYDSNFFGEHTLKVQYNDVTTEKTFNIEDTFKCESAMFKQIITGSGRLYYYISGSFKYTTASGVHYGDVNSFLDNGEFFVVISNPDGSNPQILQKTTITDGHTEFPAYGPITYGSFRLRLYHLNNVLLETFRI